ncbi:Serine/Threonine kinase domain protein (macronuclear) [Tetrahymena thermophila SB210]|uniref:Serine/Threonine kinase domain protein n=1 Tax=Tetrahymena thermophila (strain SB210) TaxID=312017 RepID=Q22MG9_TETTS|nr:Serine/Threonine kinase domain protein [Tetrahymena thermophila SB210]EAR86254.2 Serine/Threonine kinase domain protein [Tetrahymena thermophila SB210]|eukprot:XP_977051.2 Serine/Threonine kinase domain protein [Tetrahymena thermophila SB210]
MSSSEKQKEYVVQKSIDSLNTDRRESDQSAKQTGLPEILKRPKERKYGQDVLIEQQQKLRSSYNGRLLTQSEKLNIQSSNPNFSEKQDDNLYSQLNISQGYVVQSCQQEKNRDSISLANDDVSLLKRGNQSSATFLKQEQDFENESLLTRTNDKSSKAQKSYTSFAQQVKGGAYSLNRNNNSSYGQRKLGYSSNQIQKLDENIRMLEQNLQQLKKSQVKTQQNKKLSSSPYKARPITASAEKKINEEKIEAYNRLYNIDENLQDQDHLIVNFNANYYNKKKPARLGINNLDKKAQISPQVIQEAIKYEEKLIQNKKQQEAKKFSGSGQNNLRIRKLETTKMIKETPLSNSKRINTIEESNQNVPFSTTAAKSTKPELSEKRDFSDTQNFSLQDVTANNQSTKSKNELDNYKLGPLIGKGSYATVRLATDLATNEQVAIKFYEKFKLFDPQKKKNVQREISILKKISHPHCIGMQKTFENSKNICVVMEYVGKDSLYTYLKSFEGRKLPEEEAKRIFKQIIKGVSYLHTNNIIHRDMKLENLLMDDTKNIKIIDFGFSIMIPPDKKLNIFCGTPSYMAPEIVSKKEYYGPPVDIWACGILLYVMLVGTFPFKAADDKTLYFKIRNGNYDLPPHVSVGARQILKKILNVNYHERATAEEILMDTWVSPMNIVRKIDELRAQIKQKQNVNSINDEEEVNQNKEH